VGEREKMKIIPGISSQLLAARIASELGGNVSLCEFKRFPDGELYTRVLDDVKDEEVTIVQSIITDSDLICLLQLIDAVEEAHETTVVIPYLGYARQDNKFKPGEAISARAVARCLCLDTIRMIYVVNVHRSEEHTSELQSLAYLVCRLLLEKTNIKTQDNSLNYAYKSQISTKRY